MSKNAIIILSIWWGEIDATTYTQYNLKKWQMSTTGKGRDIKIPTKFGSVWPRGWQLYYQERWIRDSETTTHHMDGGPRLVVSIAAFHSRVSGAFPGLGGLKETKTFLHHPLVKLSFVGSLCDREVACSTSDRQGSNFESCVWRAVSSHPSHHPREVLQAQFSLYVHKSPIHFILTTHHAVRTNLSIFSYFCENVSRITLHISCICGYISLYIIRLHHE